MTGSKTKLSGTGNFRPVQVPTIKIKPTTGRYMSVDFWKMVDRRVICRECTSVEEKQWYMELKQKSWLMGHISNVIANLYFAFSAAKATSVETLNYGLAACNSTTWFLVIEHSLKNVLDKFYSRPSPEEIKMRGKTTCFGWLKGSLKMSASVALAFFSRAPLIAWGWRNLKLPHTLGWGLGIPTLIADMFYSTDNYLSIFDLVKRKLLYTKVEKKLHLSQQTFIATMNTSTVAWLNAKKPLKYFRRLAKLQRSNKSSYKKSIKLFRYLVKTPKNWKPTTSQPSEAIWWTTAGISGLFSLLSLYLTALVFGNAAAYFTASKALKLLLQGLGVSSVAYNTFAGVNQTFQDLRTEFVKWWQGDKSKTMENTLRPTISKWAYRITLLVAALSWGVDVTAIKQLGPKGVGNIVLQILSAIGISATGANWATLATKDFVVRSGSLKADRLSQSLMNRKKTIDDLSRRIGRMPLHVWAAVVKKIRQKDKRLYRALFGDLGIDNYDLDTYIFKYVKPPSIPQQTQPHVSYQHSDSTIVYLAPSQSSSEDEWESETDDSDTVSNSLIETDSTSTTDSPDDSTLIQLETSTGITSSSSSYSNITDPESGEPIKKKSCLIV